MGKHLNLCFCPLLMESSLEVARITLLFMTWWFFCAICVCYTCTVYVSKFLYEHVCVRLRLSMCVRVCVCFSLCVCVVPSAFQRERELFPSAFVKSTEHAETGYKKIHNY